MDEDFRITNYTLDMILKMVGKQKGLVHSKSYINGVLDTDKVDILKTANKTILRLTLIRLILGLYINIIG